MRDDEGIGGTRADGAALLARLEPLAASLRAEAARPRQPVAMDPFVESVVRRAAEGSPALAAATRALDAHLGCAAELAVGVLGLLYSGSARLRAPGEVAPVARPALAAVEGVSGVPDFPALRAACAHDRLAAVLVADAVVADLAEAYGLAEAAATAQAHADAAQAHAEAQARAADATAAALAGALADDGDGSQGTEGPAAGGDPAGGPGDDTGSDEGALARALAAAQAFLEAAADGDGEWAADAGGGDRADDADDDPGSEVLRAHTKAAAHGAVVRAHADVQATRAACRALGLGTGELVGVDPAARLRLAEACRTEGFRALVALLGRMRIQLGAERVRRTTGGRHTVYAVKAGRDPSDFLPGWFAHVAAGGPLRMQALADAADGRVLSRKWRGEAPAAGGPVVVVLDCSGSMEGAKELWAKAFTLALAGVCRTERRGFAAVPFAWQARPTVVGAGLEEALEVAGLPTGGGTVLAEPLDAAADAVEHGLGGGADWSVADVVLVTDGQAAVDPAWLRRWAERRAALGLRCRGVFIGAGTPPQVLADVCDTVQTLSDLTSGSDVAHLVRTL